MNCCLVIQSICQWWVHMLVSIGVTGLVTLRRGGKRNFNLWRIQVKKEGISPHLSLHHPNNYFENMSVFIFASHQLRSQKKLFLGRKMLEGHFPSLAPPVLHLCWSLLFVCKCLILNGHLSGTERFFLSSFGLEYVQVLLYTMEY